MALKAETIGLAASVELPLIVCDIQRAGPSTGMPTKTEQADLLQALFGRNGESPVAVLAPATPGDCFTIGLEAKLITRLDRFRKKRNLSAYERAVSELEAKEMIVLARELRSRVQKWLENHHPDLL